MATHIISPLLLPEYTLREVLENIKSGMVQHPSLAIPNDSNKDIWSYYELLQLSPIVFNDHLVVTLQVPLADKSLVTNVYEAYNFAILHPVLQKAFQYSL